MLGNWSIILNDGVGDALSFEDVVARIRAVPRYGPTASAVFALALTTGADLRVAMRFAPKREADRLQRARCVRLASYSASGASSRYVVFPPAMFSLCGAAAESINSAARLCRRTAQTMLHGMTLQAARECIDRALLAAGLAGVTGCRLSAFRDEFFRRFWVAFGYSDPWTAALHEFDRTPVGYALLRLHASFLALIGGVCPVRCQLPVLRAVAQQAHRAGIGVRDRRLALRLIEDVDVSVLESVLCRIDELHAYPACEILNHVAANRDAGRFDWMDLPADSFSRVWLRS